jgi:hypothetical protein
MPAERKDEWLQRARRDFQTARATYEQQLGLVPRPASSSRTKPRSWRP